MLTKILHPIHSSNHDMKAQIHTQIAEAVVTNEGTRMSSINHVIHDLRDKLPQPCLASVIHCQLLYRLDLYHSPCLSTKRPKKKKKRRHNQLGLTPRTEEHESSEEEDDQDEESKLAAAAGAASQQYEQDLDLCSIY